MKLLNISLYKTPTDMKHGKGNAFKFMEEVFLKK